MNYGVNINDEKPQTNVEDSEIKYKTSSLIFVVVNSINVYEQYCAECPGLSIHPSPKKTLFIVTNKILRLIVQ
jgi:hypothetical protein